MGEYTCKFCSTTFKAREADRKRGWALYCSKACKAKHQTKSTGIAGPHYRAQGKRWYPTTIAYEPWDEEVEAGDVKYSHRHGCWLVRDNGGDPFIDRHPFDMED